MILSGKNRRKWKRPVLARITPKTGPTELHLTATQYVPSELKCPGFDSATNLFTFFNMRQEVKDKSWPNFLYRGLKVYSNKYGYQATLLG